MSDLENIKSQRRYIVYQIKKALSTAESVLKKPVDQENAETLEACLQEVKEAKTEFLQLQQQLLTELNQQDKDFLKKEEEIFREGDQIQTWLVSYTGRIRAYQNQLTDKVSRQSLLNTSTDAGNVATPILRLPKIEIPNFEGDIRQFSDFIGLFRNLVHDNPHLSKIQKLYYLKNSLAGDAAKITKDVELSENAYEESWAKLLERYDNKLLAIKTYLTDLFGIEKAKYESELRKVLDEICAAIKGLKICGEPVDSWSSLLSYYLCSKIDDRTRRDFEDSITDKTVYPSFENLRKFVENRAINAETRKITESVVIPVKKKSFVTTSSPSTVIRTIKKYVCSVCPAKDRHLLIECQDFLSKSPQKRFDFIKEKGLCTNCFGDNHSAFTCKRLPCKICQKKHHSLLHFESEHNKTFQPSPSTSTDMPSQKIENTKIAATNLSYSNQKTIILPTATIFVSCGNIFSHARILLDNCSQVTLISDTFARKMRFPSYQADHTTHVNGIGGTVVAGRKCDIKLISRYSSFKIRVQADIVPQTSLPYSLEKLKIADHRNLFKDLNLADPAFSKPIINIPNIDILLGAEYVESCLLNETQKFNSLTLRNTNFGWAITGPVSDLNTYYSSKPNVSLSLLAVHDLEKYLTKFWEVEEVISPKLSTAEEKECELHFLKTYSRADDGQFVVRLPFKPNVTELGDSEKKAINSFYRLEHSLSDPIKKEYIKFMSEYQALDHMEPTPIHFCSKYVIPHRHVTRPNSTTTKLRVVFNASAPTTNGLSLNDVLLKGPSIQKELFDILITFRTHRIAFVGDIEKMYRKVLVHPDDRAYQTIFWRRCKSDPVLKYSLKTVTYGTKPASFLTTKCLDVLASSVEITMPPVSFAIRNQFYMDDLITGSDSVENAIRLQKNIHSTLASAHFHLRKYQSNSNELLENIDQCDIEQKLQIDFKNEKYISVLGIGWQPKTDQFKIKISADYATLPQKLTKRILLAQISSVFDPLGFTTPVTIKGKLFMQKLWLLQSEWDTPLPEEIETEYRNYFQDFVNLQKLSLPRLYSVLFAEASNRLIAFCDASPHAYCAVVYVRSISPNSEISSRFVCAKTRVAPLKSLTIPRLELLAALLLAELVNRISLILNLPLKSAIVYSDSQIVLSWLAKPAREWKQFVANRVNKISEILPFSQWHFVNSKENPADLGTRGITSANLIESNLWFSGPTFILDKSLDNLNLPEINNTLSLEKRKIEKFCNIITKDIPFDDSFIHRFSKYNLLIYVTARILKLFNNFKNKNKIEPCLSVTDLDNSLFRIIRIVQFISFKTEYCRLKKGLEMKKGNALRQLDPFLDSNQVIRVGGRLERANVSYDKKHPIILPVKHHFTVLLLRYIHERYCHASRNFIQVFLKARYHFHGNLTNAIKNILFNCTTCARYRAKTPTQIMSDLPQTRVIPSRPFSFTGVDFAGSFDCKPTGYRSKLRFKIYAAIFVCFSTRATHIEIVASLTTEDFINALHRFVARRGRPNRIYSDNAKNFRGARTFLKLDDENLHAYALAENIQWSFIPPRTPHFGGIWEASVKLAKYHLVRVMKDNIFTYEQYITVFARIEGILNSRPITYRLQSSDMEIITPGHFLIGDSLCSLPEPHQSPNIRLTSHYNEIKKRINSFWSLWSRDYLAQLQLRNKWTTTTTNFQVNDVVLLKDDLLKPAYWSYGKITAVYPDNKGNVRVVDVLAKDQVKRRAINSLVPLIRDQ